MGQISKIQDELKHWMEYNFGKTPDHHGVLGTVEEIGELALALGSSVGKLSYSQLKLEKGIRRTPEELAEMAQDAIGDIFLCLLGYCVRRGWSAEDIFEKTWNEVKTRDWIKNPKNGVTE
jgi:NTP pyrophosphatase (non-canonical NTP hydrolase)